MLCPFNVYVYVDDHTFLHLPQPKHRATIGSVQQVLAACRGVTLVEGHFVTSNQSLVGTVRTC